MEQVAGDGEPFKVGLGSLRRRSAVLAASAAAAVALLAGPAHAAGGGIIIVVEDMPTLSAPIPARGSGGIIIVTEDMPMLAAGGGVQPGRPGAGSTGGSID